MNPEQNQNTGNQDGRLFGFSYQQPDLDELASKVSPVPPNMDDGVTVAAGGTIYKVGDVVTIDKATLELNGSFGGGNVFQGDLELLVTEDNVSLKKSIIP